MSSYPGKSNRPQVYGDKHLRSLLSSFIVVLLHSIDVLFSYFVPFETGLEG